MTETQWDVVYCEGWEPEARTLVGRLSAAAARERHERGEQYAVALTDEAGKPQALLEIALAQRFVRVWHFDEQGRRPLCFTHCVLTDGRLFLRGTDEWRNLDEEKPAHVALRYKLDGSWIEDTTTVHGVKTKYAVEGDVEELFQPVPAFGDWLPLARPDEPVALRDIADPETTDPAPPPWRPPVPMRPFALAETFTPGTRFALSQGTVTVEVRPAGTLRLTSGRVVASDPALLSYGTVPFTVTVAPGEYPVELAEVRFAENSDHVRVAAAKAVIAPGPVTSWELALRPGEDSAMLDDGTFYGFGVDAGLACLLDADALPALAADHERFLEDHLVDLEDDPVEVPEPKSGANLVAFRSGWGDGVYPTWVGRAEDGTVAAFVVDLLVVHGGELVS